MKGGGRGRGELEPQKQTPWPADPNLLFVSHRQKGS